MAENRTLSNRSYRLTTIVLAVAIIGMTVANVYAMWHRDQCTETVQTRLESSKARLEAAKAAFEKNKSTLEKK